MKLVICYETFEARAYVTAVGSFRRACNPILVLRQEDVDTKAIALNNIPIASNLSIRHGKTPCGK